MYFDRGSYGAVFVRSPLTNCYVTSVNPEFGTTLARRLSRSRVVPYCSRTYRHARSTTSGLGLTSSRKARITSLVLKTIDESS